MLSDGSELRSLSGRSAKLGDGLSRNPRGRDALLEQRTQDLQGLIGQLRGFDLDGYLGDQEEEEGKHCIPWTIGDDALPSVPRGRKTFTSVEGMRPKFMSGGGNPNPSFPASPRVQNLTAGGKHAAPTSFTTSLVVPLSVNSNI